MPDIKVDIIKATAEIVKRQLPSLWRMKVGRDKKDSRLLIIAERMEPQQDQVDEVAWERRELCWPDIVRAEFVAGPNAIGVHADTDEECSVGDCVPLLCTFEYSDPQFDTKLAKWCQENLLDFDDPSKRAIDLSTL